MFGKVTKGLDVVSLIEKTPVNKKNDRPLETIKIIQVDVNFIQ